MSAPGPTKQFAQYLGEVAARAARNESTARATLAALRRGAGKELGAAPEMFPYLVPWTAELDQRTQEAYYLVASLFALHPATWPAPEGEQYRDVWRRNFGASMRRVALDDTQDVQGTSTERRVVTLLASDWDSLPTRLRHAVSLCAARDVPVAWDTLLPELLHWDHTRRRTQLDWARAFWYVSPATSADEDKTNNEE
jgi:CRISPR system Cascade subunit CasB